MRTVLWAAGAGVGAMAVLAVLAIAHGDSKNPRSVETPGGVVLIAGPTEDNMEAAFQGRLEFTADGCLGLAGPGQAEAQTVLIFPANAAVVESSPLKIEVNGKVVRIGQSFSGGGGYVSDPGESELIPEIPNSCLGQEVFLVSTD
ncbi:hypothetical protein [Nocardioides marmoraquaticus]